MLPMVMEREAHSVNYKRSSGKEISIFHFALITIQGLISGEISKK